MEEDDIKFGKDTFVGLTHKSLRDSYNCIAQLGKGGYGKVYQVKNKISGKLFACKKLSKLNIKNLEKFQREISILMRTDHPNIIKLYEYFESPNSLYLIMEECYGGELFDRIMEHIEKKEMYTEKEAAEIIRQVMSAVEYCHNNGIVHRDLKPENLLYLKKGSEENNPLKVIDFGLSQTLDTKKILSSKVGTAYYVSPEILAGKYTEKCISSEAKDLLSHMLATENERYSASQVLAHPWFEIAKKRTNIEQLDFSSQFFREYIQSNQLKKIVLIFIASRLQESEINDLKEIFQAFDTDNDGQINYGEFEQSLLRLKSKEIKPAEIRSYFSSIDTDKNGKIDYTEFVAACLNKKNLLTEERLYEAFTKLDIDHNGKITKNELMSVLKLEANNDKFVTELIKQADKNSDGVIDYKEFLEFMGFQQ